jgi:hypothetical protein
VLAVSFARSSLAASSPLGCCLSEFLLVKHCTVWGSETLTFVSHDSVVGEG